MMALKKGCRISCKDFDFDVFRIEDIVIGQLSDYFIDFNGCEPNLLLEPVGEHVRYTGESQAQNQAGTYRMFIPS
jgi:hypothetical protein